MASGCSADLRIAMTSPAQWKALWLPLTKTEVFAINKKLKQTNLLSLSQCHSKCKKNYQIKLFLAKKFQSTQTEINGEIKKYHLITQYNCHLDKDVCVCACATKRNY